MPSAYSTDWNDIDYGTGRPKMGSGPPGGEQGGGSTHHQRIASDIVTGASEAKRGGAKPSGLPAGGRTTYYARSKEKSKGETGGGEHNASEGRIRDVGGS